MHLSGQKMASSFKFKSFIKEIDKKMDKEERHARTEAAKHVRKRLKDVSISRFGRNSNITKGIGYKNLKKSTVVGVGTPGNHAHLIEFGTDDRYTKAGKPAGHVTANPFVIPTFEEEKDKIIEILRKEWF
jgi:HK97 gp10 family phage protein